MRPHAPSGTTEHENKGVNLRAESKGLIPYFHDSGIEGTLDPLPYSECSGRLRKARRRGASLSRRRRLLLMKPPGDRKTAVKGPVAGKDLPVAADGDRADQHIDWASLASPAPAFVIQTRGVLVIGGVDWLVEKGTKSGLDLVVLRRLFDSRQKFQTDHPDHHDASILDGLRQLFFEPLLIRAEAGCVLATQRERPHGGVDEYFHPSLPIRSRRRLAL